MNRNILNSQSSPSYEAMKKTNNLAILNGGVTQDSPSNIENIREISRKLDTNVLPFITTRNLIKYSEEFDNIIWQKTRTTVSSGFTGPFNINNAFKITENVDVINTTHRFEQDVTILPNTNYIISFYAKASERFFLALNNSDGLSSTTSIFNLTAGTTDTPSRSTISSVGNGWYRCTVTRLMGATVGTGIAQFFLCNDSGVISYSGNGTSGLYLYGVQSEIGTVATTYQPTKYIQTNLELTSANFLFVPSSYGESKIFSQSPNLRNIIPFSEELDNAAWTKTQTTITPNSITAPNGTLTADKVVESTAFTIHTCRTTNRTVTGNYVASIYLKAGERTVVNFGHGTGGSRRMNIDLVTGAFTISPSPQFFIGSVTNAGNGWWRASFFNKNREIESSISINLAPESGGTESYSGDGVSGFYAWGAQLEKSATPEPTQYQRTTDGISDLTFTRATSSTITNKLGYIEDGCYNKVQFSEDFSNAIWIGNSYTKIITSNLNPFGRYNTCYYEDTNTLQPHQGYQLVSNLVSGTVYTAHYYVRKADDTWCQFRIGSTSFGSIYWVNFNFDTGLFGNSGASSGFTYNVVLLNNGFYLITLIATSIFTGGANSCIINGTDNTNAITPALNYVGSVRKFVEVAAIQLEQGSIPRPYLKTTNKLNVPCLDYSRSLLEPSLMIEPQRTNLLLRSEDFSDATWIKTGANISLNTILNPFGVSKSYYLGEDTALTNHLIRTNTSVTSGSVYTVSWYVKKASHSWIQITFGTTSFTDNNWVNFNFDTGLFGNKGSLGTCTAKQLANGYWLLTYTVTAVATGNNASVYLCGTNNTDSATKLPSYIGTGADICNIAACQFELGTNATSYIPTTTATVTRNGETAYVDLWNNNMLFQTNWSLYWEGYLYNGQTTAPSFCLSDTNTAAANTNQIGWIDTIQPFYNISSARTDGISSTTSNSFNKFMIQYNNGIANFFVNGINVFANKSVPVFDYRYLVLNNGGSTFATDKICLFNRTLSLGECINLTNPNYNTFEALTSAYTYTLII